MRIYTKTGDTGETGLAGGQRVPKTDVRIEAYGTLDELNSVLGLAQNEQLPDGLSASLQRVQNELFVLGAWLATEPSSRTPASMTLEPECTQLLETEIDSWTAELPTLKNFVLPGGTGSASTLHLARTVCRRTERRLVSLAEAGDQVSAELAYLNRLSDWLFVLARLCNLRANVPEVLWSSNS